MNLLDKIRILSQHNEAYSTGAPTITDEEYDRLWAEIREADPLNPALFHTSAHQASSFYNKPHPRPVLSLDKAMSQKDLKVFLTRVYDHPVVVTPKLHGIGAVSYGGDLVLLGDGKWGRDITGAVKTPAGNDILQGELIITQANWSPDLGKVPHSVVSGKILSWAKAPEDNKPPMFPVEFIPFPWLRNYNSFTFNPWEVMGDLNKLEARFLEFYYTNLKKFPLDGLVLEITNPEVKLRLGTTEYFPRWAIAWKPPISTARTRVDHVAWNISRTGRVIPTIYYDPVELCSTINTKATANNMTWLKNKRLAKGSLITVGKAGEIIPQILDADPSPTGSSIPTNCPACKTELRPSGLDLVCPNPECVGAAIKRLAYFYSQSGIFISGLGEKTMEKILTRFAGIYPALAERPWLFLLMSTKGNFKAPFYFNATALRVYMEQKFPALFVSIMDQLNILRNKPIHKERLIAALGIPTIGEQTAKYILLATVHGKLPYGAKLNKGHYSKFVMSFDLINRMLSDLSTIGYHLTNPSMPSDKTFSITGEFFITRDEIVSRLTALGWQYHPSPTRYTNHMLVGSLKSPSRKLLYAESHGITMLRGDQALEDILCGGTTNAQG